MDAPGIPGLRSARGVQRAKSRFKSATASAWLDIPDDDDDDDEEETETFGTNDRRPIVSEAPNRFDIAGNTGPGLR